MILKQVTNFSQYPDGRIRMAGINLDPCRLARLMENAGIQVGCLGEVGHCASSLAGTSVSAAGEGVFGYLLDEEGLELPSSDLDCFLELSLGETAPITIEGHRCPDHNTMITSSLMAWRSGGAILISSRRELLRSDGSRQVINLISPGAGPESRGSLSLAG